jgi:predicted HicB family RNase H-like nuclease
MRRTQMEKDNKPNNDDFDGFTINVFLDEDGDYLAHLVELPNVSAFAETPVKAIEELKVAWYGMKECYEEDGEPIPVAPSRKQYSGTFNIRIDKQLHRALAIEAAKAGVSLNALVAQKLATSTSVDAAVYGD